MEGAENLPLDCLQSIFSRLSGRDLKSVSLVCKEFLANVNLSKESLKVVHPKVSVLSAHLKRFTFLKRIDLRSFDGDIDEAIVEIARSGKDIEALDISCLEGIKIETLVSNLKNLKILNFHMVGHLQDNDLVLIANSFPNLEELHIGYFSTEGILKEGIEYLASKLKRLKTIVLSGKHKISDKYLLAFSLNCLFLKEVVICSGCHTVTENGVGLLLRNSPNLETLCIAFVKLNSSQSTITFENSISHAKALSYLQFIKMEVSDTLLNAIAKAKLQLKKFWLTICNNFTVAGLLAVLADYQLTQLHITGSRTVDRDINLLLNGNVSKLTHIEISLCEVTKPTLYLLSTKCPALEQLRISSNGDRQSEHVIDELGFLFPNLRVLNLCLGYHHITTISIKAILKSCKFLRILRLGGRLMEEFIEADESELSELKLEELTLINSKIGDELLAQIAKICPRLVYLDLSFSSKLTTEGVKRIIKNITTLNCLCIRGGNHINHSVLLEWMLSTGNFASLEKIYVGGNCDFSKEQSDGFEHHGCLLLRW